MQQLSDRVAEHRTPEHDVDPIFPNRGSPRSMTGEPLATDEFMPLFEAARLAPSSRNEQHWRFCDATREDEAWETFLEFPYEKNREWARDAAVPAVICSQTAFESDGSTNGTHAFDTGAASVNLALEGARRGLAVHAMARDDDDLAPRALNVPASWAVYAMVAIGEPAPEAAPGSEQPNGRKPLDEVVIHGGLDEAAGEVAR